jgi:cell division septation protein DedD
MLSHEEQSVTRSAAAPIALANATSTAAVTPPALGGGYAVQVTSERSESRAQAAFRALQAKYPNQLSGRQAIIRRAYVGVAGIYYRALVGPFASAEKAAKLCSGLKAAGGDCIILKN